MTREIKKNWAIAYLNKFNKEHREEDNPSAILFDGDIYFCKNNKFHRQGKPCMIKNDGSFGYCEDDKFVKRIQI